MIAIDDPHVWYRRGSVSICALVVFLAALFPLINTDIWWHLAAGREILASGGWLHTDTLSSGAEGATWIDLHWGFQLLALGIFRLAGVGGLVVAKTLVFLAGVLVLLRTARLEVEGGGWPLVALAVALPLVLARHLVLARPIVLTLLYISIVILMVERYRRAAPGSKPASTRRLFLILVPLQVAWANTQGLFLLGPALIAAYGVGSLFARFGFAPTVSPRRARNLALLFAALVICSVITPYGARGMELPFRLLGRIDPVGGKLYRHNVSENIPPRLRERQAPDEVAHFKWVSAAVFASFLLVPRETLVLERFFALVGLFSLAWIANRNILLFYWLGGLFGGINLANAMARLLASASRARRAWRVAVGQRCCRVAPLLALGGLLLLAVCLAVALTGEGDIRQPAPFRVPQRSVAYLESIWARSDRVPFGQIFNSIRYGGYLAWRLHRRARPFIDGRLVIRTPAQFARYLELVDEPETFEAFARSRDISTVILPTALPSRHIGLVRWLYRRADWRLLFTDGTETLFVREDRLVAGMNPLVLDSAAVRDLVRTLARRWQKRPEVLEQALRNLAIFLAEIGLGARAIDVLSSRDDRRARVLLARVWYLSGRWQRARSLARSLLKQSPDDASCLTLLALIAADRQQHRRALGLLRRVLERDPFHPQARELLVRVRRSLGLR